MPITLLRQLIEASEAGLPALTVEIGRIYLEEEPDGRAALLLVGQALVDMARYAEARALYERALAVSESDRRHQVLMLLGHLYGARSELREAESYYRRAVEADPDHASAYIYLGAMLAKNGRFDEAEALHRRATRCRHGVLSEAHLNLGFVLRARGRYLDALESFRTAFQLDPDDDAAEGIRDMEQLLFHFPAVTNG